MPLGTVFYLFDVFAVVVFAVSGAFLTTFIVRSLAITLGWSLPVFQPRSRTVTNRDED